MNYVIGTKSYAFSMSYVISTGNNVIRMMSYVISMKFVCF